MLGIWCSAGGQTVDNELTALIQAINRFGDAFVRLVAGISVGSEDLYRNSPTGMANGENPGINPDILVSYIKKTRDAIAGTKLAGKPVGHVDTWTAWVNGTNKLVTDACDWVGMDAYPYFQSKVSNAIQYNNGLFEDALRQTQAAASGKPVWITETGFPVSGAKSGDAIPSIENAKVYWDQVGCPRFGNVNTWWFTLQDHSGPLTGAISFGIIGGSLTTKPLFDISCGGLPVPRPEPRPNTPPASKSASPSTTSSAAVVSRSDAPKNSSDTETSTDDSSPSTSTGAGYSISADAATSATGTPSPSNSTVPGLTAMGGSIDGPLGAVIIAMVFAVFAV